jgi:glycosyltransferase involved in cell wall biosynthesis
MSCGTPVVCFDNTSISEIVDHKVNGYIVKNFDADLLKKGIDWLSKEIKLKTGKTLHNRFQTLFNDILFNPHSTWVYKVKRFSYNYVYRNCRSTLAENYRTSTK